MIDYRYTVSGMEVIDAIAKALRLDAARDDISEVIDEMAGDAANYPPPPSNSTYIRTGRLRDGWLDGQTLFPTATATELEAVRANSVDYAHWVMGADDQAAVHQGRWRTVDQLMDAWEGRIAAAIEAGIDQRVGI